MSYPASIEKALAYLQTKDIPKGYRKHPWFYRWLWKKGIEIHRHYYQDVSLICSLLG